MALSKIFEIKEKSSLNQLTLLKVCHIDTEIFKKR